MSKLPLPTVRPWQQHTCNRSTTASTPALASTAVTSATGVTLVNSSATWTTNQYQNFWVTILTGTGAGQTRNITSNTSTTLTVPTWTVTPDNTSTFSIAQPLYPGLQGSLVPASTGGAVLANVTYREVVPTAGATQITARFKTTTAVGTLTITPIRLLAVSPDDPAIYLQDGSIDTTKVQKYGTGGSSVTNVSAGTELALSINPAGEAYCLLEFACTTAGTLNYCDVMTLQSTGTVSGGGGGGGGAVTVADGADVAEGATTDAAVTGDNTGTISAKVRGLNKIAADEWDSTNHRAKVGVTDGTNFLPTMDAVGRAGYIKVTDGTNTAPTMDAIGRAGFQKLTDGTTVVGVDAGTAAINVNIAKDSTAAPTSPLLVQVTDATNGTNTMPTGDTTGRAIFTQNTGLAGEAHLGEVGGNTLILKPTVTVSTSAYSAGNCVGGLITLTNAMRKSSGTGAIPSLSIQDHANQKAPLDILIFDSSPAGTFTDHSAFPTMSAADNAKVIQRISVAATDYVTIGGTAYASPVISPKALAASGSANLYMAINTSGTPTYANTGDLLFALGFFRD